MHRTTHVAIVLALVSCNKDGETEVPNHELEAVPELIRVPVQGEPLMRPEWKPPSIVATPDGAGDPNVTPIHAWFAYEDGKPDRVYVLGHATHDCCRKVSSAFAQAEWEPAFRQKAWFSYGVGDFDANGDVAGQQQLAELRREIETYTDDVCRGQLIIHDLGEDLIDKASEDVMRVSELAYQAALQQDRPVMLWYELPAEVPALVPPLAIGRRGAGLEPVTFSISHEELQFPKSAVEHVSLDGVGQLVSDMRNDIEIREYFLALRKVLEFAGERTLDYEMVRTTFHEVRGFRASLERKLIDSIEVFQEVDDLYGEILESVGYDSPRLRRELELSRAEYVKLRGKAETELEKLRSQGGGIAEIAVPRLIRPLSAADLLERIPPATKLAKEIDIGRKNLAWAQSLESSPPPDPNVPLVDAAIRGWPATFGEESAEASFDQWAREHQSELLRAIDRKLDAKGYGFDLEDILGYRVLFRPRPTAGGHSVAPMYALNDGFYIVADPGSGLVTFESPSSDENLDPPKTRLGQ